MRQEAEFATQGAEGGLLAEVGVLHLKHHGDMGLDGDSGIGETKMASEESPEVAATVGPPYEAEVAEAVEDSVEMVMSRGGRRVGITTRPGDWWERTDPLVDRIRGREFVVVLGEADTPCRDTWCAAREGIGA